MSPTLLLLMTAGLLLLPHLIRPRGGKPADIRTPLELGLWWFVRSYCGFWHRLAKPVGMAPLPEHGPAILISNHTCGIDNFILQAACRRKLGFLIVQDWYDFWMLRPFCQWLDCIPVRRDGRDLAAARAALRALERGRVVPIFPEGRITPCSGREFGTPHPGSAFLALRSHAPVIPAYISGTPRTSDIFRALCTPSRARVVFGPPVDLSRFATDDDHIDKQTLRAATDALFDAVRSLRDRFPPDAPPEALPTTIAPAGAIP
jgi:1-acyl-sn-glycerol-3-phosphate acyltransferase